MRPDQAEEGRGRRGVVPTDFAVVREEQSLARGNACTFRLDRSDSID
jgi:hypothetical protein